MKRWVAIANLTLFFALSGRAELGLPDASNLDEPAKVRAAREESPAPPTTIAPPVGRRVAPVEGLLRFRNGDSLHGVVEHIDGAGQIEWRHSEARDPLRFSLRNVMQISLANPGTNTLPHSAAAVYLTNGDTLRGTVTGLDATTLRLETWYAGPLNIKRTMVRLIEPSLSGEAVVVEGFGSFADWKRGGQPEAWQLRNGALISSQYGSIGRHGVLPGRSRVEFDMAWQQLPAMMQVGLFGQRADALPNDGTENAYWVGFTGYNVQLVRAAGNASIQLGNADVRKFMRNGKVHVTILADRAKQTIALLLDEQLVKIWADPGVLVATGGCLTFASQASGDQNLRLSNLLVREWAGDIDGDGPVVAKHEDVLCLANNDRVTGRVKSVKAGAVVVDSPVASLTIPLERVAQIHFANTTNERARRMAPDVMAVFQEGGRVTVALESLSEKALTGQSENFGKVSFTRAAFRELQLHIYDENRGEDADIDAGAIPSWTPMPQRLPLQ